LIVLLGKTCVGKSEIAKAIEGRGYKRIITYTTRPIREHEIDNIDYHFIDTEDFLGKQENNFFGETRSYNTVHGKWYYGSAWEDYAKNSVIVLTPCGLEQMMKDSTKCKEYDIFPVLITANKDVVMERGIERKDEEEMIRRMAADDVDFIGVDKLNPLEITNNGDLSPYQVANQIISEYEEFLSDKTKENASLNYKEIVYISHAFGGNTENKYRVRDIAKRLNKEYPDYLFVSPIHTFGFLYDTVSYDEGLNMCLALLNKCSLMWVFDDYEDSMGVQAEIEFCKNNNIRYKVWDYEETKELMKREDDSA